MRRVLMLVLVAVVLQSPAMAITHFKKIWGEHYTPKKGEPGSDAVSEDFRKLATKAACNICHVKGEDKKKVRNEYGEAMMSLLKAEDFTNERIKAEPEKVKEEIIAAFKAVEELKSKDDKTFGEKIKEGVLPATDAKLE
jgi:hypothetical protein